MGSINLSWCTFLKHVYWYTWSYFKSTCTYLDLSLRNVLHLEKLLHSWVDSWIPPSAHLQLFNKKLIKRNKTLLTYLLTYYSGKWVLFGKSWKFTRKFIKPEKKLRFLIQHLTANGLRHATCPVHSYDHYIYSLKLIIPLAHKTGHGSYIAFCPLHL